jgi:hypothetical protein
MEGPARRARRGKLGGGGGDNIARQKAEASCPERRLTVSHLYLQRQTRQATIGQRRSLRALPQGSRWMILLVDGLNSDDQTVQIARGQPAGASAAGPFGTDWSIEVSDYARHTVAGSDCPRANGMWLDADDDTAELPAALTDTPRCLLLQSQGRHRQRCGRTRRWLRTCKVAGTATHTRRFR